MDSSTIMSNKEVLHKIAEKLKEKQRLENPEKNEEFLGEDFEGDMDVKLFDDVFQHVMHKRHLIKQKYPEKIEKIERECNHPNQTEDLTEISLQFDRKIEDDFIFTDLEELEPDWMVGGKISPAEVAIVDETPPRRKRTKTQSMSDDVILTTRDVRLESASSDLSSMDDRSSLDTLSMTSSDGSRGTASPSGTERHLTKSVSFDDFSHRGSSANMRTYSVSDFDDKEFNGNRSSSRQQVLKQMRINMKKSKRERKEEIALIEKQKQRRKEIAEKVKQETIREEVLKGTYSERLDNSLGKLLHKFEQDNKDDMVALETAMHMLNTND